MLRSIFSTRASSLWTRQFSSSVFNPSKDDFLQKVKELRKLTSAPIIDCKKALEENNGSLEEAQKYLIQKGLSQMAKQQDRVTEQGSVWIVTGQGRAAFLEMNCQTDFVAGNDSFKEALNICTSSFLASSDHGGEWISQQSGEYVELKSANVDWVMTLNCLSTTETIRDLIARLNYTTGEKVEISRASILSAPRSLFGSYVHQGRIGALVSLSTYSKEFKRVEDLNNLTRNLSIHIAGFHPTLIGTPHEDQSDQSQQDEQNRDAEALGEKVAEELMAQPFSIVGSGTVGSRILKLSKEIQDRILVTSFVRWELGGRETVAIHSSRSS